MTPPTSVTRAALLAALLPLLAAPAADWPQWRYDAGRTAASPAGLPDELNLLWEAHYSRREPVWDDPLNWDLMPYDKVFEPVVAGATMFIGFNDTDKVVALATDTGREKWTFYTDGPVRLPVCVWEDKLYASSDDGHLYCLDAQTGKLRWKRRGGPSDRRVLGNKRLISTWPARGGPVVEDGTVYFAASIWPFMGTFIYALNAETGEVVWLNDGEGARYMLQPHTSPAFAGIAPQGSLVAVGDKLLIPGGRSVPACFERQTGRFLYYQLAPNKKTGGSFVCAKGNIFFNHYRDQVTNLYALPNGAGPIPRVGQNPVLTEKATYLAGRSSGFSGYYPGNTIAAVNAELLQANPGAWKQGQLWEIAVDASDDLIKAGDCLYAAGGYRITAIRAPEGEGAPEVVWTKDIADRVGRLVAADSKLFAVTLSGKILAFGPAQRRPVRTYHTPTIVNPPAEAAGKALSIVQSSGISEGYALFLGVGDGRLLEALVCNSKLHIIAVEPDRAKVDALRRRLDSAGLYGTRVTVHHADPLAFECPPYLASLTVVNDLASAGYSEGQAFVRKLFASMRPYGGVAWLPVAPAGEPEFSATVAACGLPGAKLLTHQPPFPPPPPGQPAVRVAPVPPPKLMGPGYVLLVREGPLPGSAPWTHQYGDIANTVKSDDALVKLPLGLLWFGGSSNLDVLPRHGHGPPEQVIGGRLFIEGIDCLSARDVYTGRVLWRVSLNPQDTFGVYYDETHKDTPTSTAYNQVHLPGANARGTNFVATSDLVYVVQGNRCNVLDAATGQAARTFSLPAEEGGEPPTWGFVGVYDDALVATSTFVPVAELVPEDSSGPYPLRHYGRIAGQKLTVLDRATGQVRWSLAARNGFLHNSIVAGHGKLFCLDRQHPYIEKRMKRRGLFASPKRYRLLALDIRTGGVRWQKRADVFGTWLSYSKEFGVLLQATRPSRDMLAEEGVPRMIAYGASDGRVLWDRTFGYAGPPIIHHATIITHGASYDLLTGERKTRTNPITGEEIDWSFARQYGCDYVIASENLLSFRSAAAGYLDLLGGGGTGNFGGFKSSCTSNLVAADGVLNAPDYTRTCSCSYQNQTSLALIHDPEVETWTFDAIATQGAPVRRVGINLGAPGDRLAPDGTWWIEGPGAGGPTPNVPMEILPETVEYFRRHSSSIRGDGLKWVAASGVSGPAKITVSLAPPTSVAAPPCSTPPKIDGIPDDPCWRDAAPVPFEGNLQRRTPQTDVWLRRDDTALYFAYRRKAPLVNGAPVPFVGNFPLADTPCWRDDDVEIFLTDATRQIGIQLAISCAGGSFRGRNVLSGNGFSDLTWRGDWSYAVQRQPEEWTAEAAVPFTTLRAEGIDPSKLQLNIMSQNLSRVGPQHLFLVNPGPLGFGRCHEFLPITDRPALVPERTYTVRLHFAEPEECGPGDRVFGVAIQGKTVAADLDVLTGSGGQLHPLVKEFRGIRASEALTVSLLPTANSRPPVLCGIEIAAEGW